jgi:hypothetical protein
VPTPIPDQEQDPQVHYYLQHLLLNLQHQKPLQIQIESGVAHQVALKVQQLTKILEKAYGTSK